MSQDICEVLLTAIDILDERRAQISAVDDFTAFDNIEEEKAVAVASNPFGDILLQEQMQMESGTITVNVNGAQRFTWPVNGINKGYDRLAISTKVVITGEESGSGNYGMRFTFVAANKDLSAAFDSSEFLGTPWMKGFDMLQKKLFDLSSLIDIQRIVVEFYNNSNVTVTFKEVSAILGYDLMNYSEKTSPLTLYVEGVENSELKYVTNAEGGLNAVMSPDKIMINARWIYKEGDNARAITAANSGDLPEGAFIRWYKYCEEAPRGDQYGGSYYGLITNPNSNPFIFQLDSGEFLTKADKTQIKAVIVYGEETYTSNLVVIRNDKSKSDEFFQNRGITLEDGSSGIYAYYDFDKNIKEDFALETAVDRVAKVTYKKNFEGDAAGKVSKTIWKIPSGLLTYIGGPSSTFTEDGYDILETDGYVESIVYRVKDAIPQTASAYKIICTMYGLDGVQYTFEKEVSLILASNSGNPVIVRLLEGDKIVHAAENGKTYTILASIYNEKGEKIEPVSIGYTPVAGVVTLDNATISGIGSTGAIVKVTFTLSENENKNVRVEEYFTIPVTNDTELWYKGPKSVIYASTGSDPIYGTGECYLYKNNVADEGIEWVINKYDNGQNPFYVPSVNGNILTPKNSYDSSMDKGYYLTASKDESIIWVQPIAVYINRFFSRIINEWDGNLQVNKDGNYILASAYVAGSKNPNGEFTGAILGELGTINDNTSKTAANNGLFGYLNGAQSFGLRADGTAFFGIEGSGRINFDGNSGIIESGNYWTTNENNEKVPSGKGSFINLANGSFNFGGSRIVYDGIETLTFSGVTLSWNDVQDKPPIIYNVLPSSNTSLKDGDLLMPIENISNDDGNVQYSAGKTYQYNSGNGTWEPLNYTDEGYVNRLDNKLEAMLSGGKNTEIGEDYVISPYIGGGYLHITSTDNNLSVIIDPQQNDKASGDWVFRIDKGGSIIMGVDENGGASFAGTIEASAGKIGRWEISELKLNGKGGALWSPPKVDRNNNNMTAKVTAFGVGLAPEPDDPDEDPVIAVGWNGVSSVYTFTDDSISKEYMPFWANAPFCVFRDGKVKMAKGEIGTQSQHWTIGLANLNDEGDTKRLYLANNTALVSIPTLGDWPLTRQNNSYLGTDGFALQGGKLASVITAGGIMVGQKINSNGDIWTYRSALYSDRFLLSYRDSSNYYYTGGIDITATGWHFYYQKGTEDSSEANKLIRALTIRDSASIPDREGTTNSKELRLTVDAIISSTQSDTFPQWSCYHGRFQTQLYGLHQLHAVHLPVNFEKKDIIIPIVKYDDTKKQYIITGIKTETIAVEASGKTADSPEVYLLGGMIFKKPV